MMQIANALQPYLLGLLRCAYVDKPKKTINLIMNPKFE